MCRIGFRGIAVLLVCITAIPTFAQSLPLRGETRLASFGQLGAVRHRAPENESTSGCCCCCDDCQRRRCRPNSCDRWKQLPLAGLFDPDRYRVLPILGNAARQAGFDIPLPHGIGGNIAYIDQPMDIFEIRVGVGGAPPTGLSDIPPFRVKSRDTNVSGRYDLWLLPFVNVYGLFGRTTGSAVGDVTVTGVPGLLPNTVIPIRIDYDGPTYGGGVTFAGGGERWFAALDINYTETDLQADDVIRARNIAPRAGLRCEKAAIWIGGFYLNVDKEISTTVDLGGTLVAIDVNLDVGTDWNFIYGGRWEPCKNLELIIEHGFSRRNQVVGAFAVRF